MNRSKTVTLIAALIISLIMGVFANLLFVGIGWWSMLAYAIGGTLLINRVYQENQVKEPFGFEPVIIIEDEDPLGVESGMITAKTNPTKH